MTFILVITTVAFIIALEFFRRTRQVTSRRDRQMLTDEPEPAAIVERYYHPAHAWAMVNTAKKEVTVGADELSGRFIGTLTGIDLPSVGKTVRQGEPLAALHHGNRTLTQRAPISGTVFEVNSQLAQRPDLLNDSPLEKGWVARIVPSNLRADLRNLLRGAMADAWRGAVQVQLMQCFSPKIGTVMQDGGQLVKNFGDQLTDEEWTRLVGQFFPFDVQYPTQNKPTNEGVIS